MRTKITLAIVAVLVIGIIAIIVSGNSANQTSSPFTNGTSAGSETLNPDATTTGSTATTTPAGAKTYSMAQVAMHTDATSCWTTISGKVYDVTTWIDQHPGGRDAILSLCGKDGTAAFMGQHGGQARPASELATFYIGVLVK